MSHDEFNKDCAHYSNPCTCGAKLSDVFEGENMCGCPDLDSCQELCTMPQHQATQEKPTATAIKERDEYHKALRAKELGKLRARIATSIDIDTYIKMVEKWDGKNYDAPYDDGICTALRFVDELIEKP